MAWWNPSTWTIVDNWQGQNKKSSEPDMSYIYNQDPNEVRGYINGRAYNYAGDWIETAKPNNKPSQDYDKAYKDALAALRTPVPRFIDYDISASWDKARQMATKAVSPIYQQKMTDFINRQKVELTRKKEDVSAGKTELQTALDRYLEDSGIKRVRTTEDTETNIGDIRDAQAFTDRTQGLNFDAANRALNEGLGAGNLATSGLGQQQAQESQLQYREMSNEQLRQTDNKIEAQNTLMNRTFQDLEIGDTRKTEDTTKGKKQLDLDLERFIQDQAYEKDQTKKQYELEKQADIASKSIGIQGQLVDQWIASLAGKGYTAQEIANAASIYK